MTYTYGGYNDECLMSETWTGNGSPLSCSNSLAALTAGNVSGNSNVATATPSAPVTVPSYSASYDYDYNGNRTSKVSNGTSTSCVYDAQNRLTSETTSGVTTTYAYDRNGNQTQRLVGSSTEELYSFDYQNRVSVYTKGNQGQSPTTSYNYRYTPTGERLAKVNATASTEEWYMSDGSDVTSDYSHDTGGGSYTLQATYVNGLSIDAKIARIVPGSPETFTYYVGDALGSVHASINSSGSVVSQALSTAWGDDLPGFTSTSTDRYGFTQREKDDESGLMHYRARSYDPRIGRFIQKDPPVGRRGRHHYAYVDSNPVSGRDPSGMMGPGPIAVNAQDEGETLNPGEDGRQGSGGGGVQEPATSNPADQEADSDDGDDGEAYAAGSINIDKLRALDEGQRQRLRELLDKERTSGLSPEERALKDDLVKKGRSRHSPPGSHKGGKKAKGWEKKKPKAAQPAQSPVVPAPPVANPGTQPAESGGGGGKGSSESALEKREKEVAAVVGTATLVTMFWTRWAMQYMLPWERYLR